MSERALSKYDHVAGVRRFAEFLRKNDITYTDAARDLRVSAPTVWEWCHGNKLPRDTNQERIAIWTHGAVRPVHWRSRDTAKVRPFARLAG